MTATVVVGQYSMTPEQMQAAGIIKPGSAPLVQSLVDKGVTLANAMPSTLFTGKQGAENLGAFAANPQAQASAVQTNMQNGAAQLVQAGAITGKESVTQVGGLIKSAATQGLSSTLSAVKGAAGSLSGAAGSLSGAAGSLSGAAGSLSGAAGALKGAAGKALGAIGSGNLAGKFADEVTSGLGPLKSAVAGVSSLKGFADVQAQAQGIAAGAFNTIKNALPKMPAGVPVNVAEVAKEAAAKAEEAAATIPGPPNNLVNAVKGAGSGLLNNAKGLASGLQNQLSGGAAALGKVASAAQGGAMADFQAAAGKVLGKTTGAPNVLGTISKIAGTAASLAPNAKGGAILGAVSSLTGSTGNLQEKLSNTLTGAVQGAVSGAVNNALDKATGGLSTKILATSSVINSITGTKATGVAGAFGSVASAISNPGAALKGALNNKLAGGVSSLASGLSNLPGGAGAAASLVNKAGGIKGKLGTLGGALDKLGGDIANKFSAQLNKVAPPLFNAADALAKSGFPSGAAAQLESAISSIGSGGGSPLKMPAVAFNTVNNDAINEQTSGLLGDPDIPPPPGGEVSQESADKLEDVKKKHDEATKKLEAAFFAATDAKKEFQSAALEYYTAEEKLPQGDPSLAGLKQKYDEAKAKLTKAGEALKAANDEFEATK